ncbi:uncharacterized protein LOC144311141 isoform X4 [Canis aureus]
MAELRSASYSISQAQVFRRVYYEKQLSQSRRKALWGIGAGKTAEHDRVGLSPHTTCLSPDRLATCLLGFQRKKREDG